MRVGTDSPVAQFIAYDSFIQETTGNIIYRGLSIFYCHRIRSFDWFRFSIHTH